MVDFGIGAGRAWSSRTSRSEQAVSGRLDGLLTVGDGVNIVPALIGQGGGERLPQARVCNDHQDHLQWTRLVCNGASALLYTYRHNSSLFNSSR